MIETPPLHISVCFFGINSLFHPPGKMFIRELGRSNARLISPQARVFGNGQSAATVSVCFPGGNGHFYREDQTHKGSGDSARVREGSAQQYQLIVKTRFMFCTYSSSCATSVWYKRIPSEGGNEAEV